MDSVPLDRNVMKKTSKYSRKRQVNNSYNGFAFMHVLNRSRAYDESPVIESWSVNTMEAAEKAMIRVRDAYMTIKNGEANPDDADYFDMLTHAFGVSTIRAIDIAGKDEFANPMLPICRAANDAMERCRVRRLSVGRWGFDGPALDQIEAAIELYETILRSSSPAQMQETTVRRIEILNAQREESA